MMVYMSVEGHVLLNAYAMYFTLGVTFLKIVLSPAVPQIVTTCNPAFIQSSDRACRGKNRKAFKSDD